MTWPKIFHKCLTDISIINSNISEEGMESKKPSSLNLIPCSNLELDRNESFNRIDNQNFYKTRAKLELNRNKFLNGIDIFLRISGASQIFLTKLKNYL